jgi:hypothetical protein
MDTRQDQGKMGIGQPAQNTPRSRERVPSEVRDADPSAGSGLHQLCSLVWLNCRSFHCSTVLSSRHWLPAM